MPLVALFAAIAFVIFAGALALCEHYRTPTTPRWQVWTARFLFGSPALFALYMLAGVAMWVAHGP